ncbi:MAG TPA: UPF0262 family protein [Stellaceae bacterium]|jgi:uncharacterized protein (UPF0262 family)|nr:UPF0262 family protein [Stellaceae bacterium]
MSGGDRRIAHVALDEKSVVRRNPDVEHERAAALSDLMQASEFAPLSGHPGPFHLKIGLEEGRLVLDIRSTEAEPVERVTLPLRPFRGIIRDYFLVCENYYAAIRTQSPSRIEAIDMGRRSLHDEGAALLRERLAERVAIDQDTARRLFTLICVLHIRS